MHVLCDRALQGVFHFILQKHRRSPSASAWLGQAGEPTEIAWAFATLISATALVPTTAYLANGAAAGIGGASAQTARSTNSSEIYVDKLFRAAPAAVASATGNASEGNASCLGGPQSGAPNSFNPARPEILRLWTADFRNGVDFSSSDRGYVAQVVAARTGLSQVDAENAIARISRWTASHKTARSSLFRPLLRQLRARQMDPLSSICRVKGPKGARCCDFSASRVPKQRITSAPLTHTSLLDTQPGKSTPR